MDIPILLSHSSSNFFPNFPPSIFPKIFLIFSFLKVIAKLGAEPMSKEEKIEEEELSKIYHSPEVFRLNYVEMERKFKVYIYPDGDLNTYYQTPRKLTRKYASEVYFFQNIQESRFCTDDPDRANLFFIPISCYKMQGKYPYWNRTLVADHFFVTCHDDVVCSPSYDVGFIPHKDVALPQVLQPFALPAEGNDAKNRTILGFCAGHQNSKIRVILAQVWETDTELYVLNNRINRATRSLTYQKTFYTTKFCICPGGSQVNSARITDSIHYVCIPNSSPVSYAYPILFF
ncbi:hypothetical protein UlMin_025517 [Ulmus minor]